MDPVALIETALATGAAAGASGTASSAVKDAYEGLKANAVAAATDGDFDSQVSRFSEQLVVVYFWAKWNIECRLAAVDVQNITKQVGGRVKVLKLDVRHNPDVPRRLGITSVPTVVIFREGDDVYRAVGFDPNLEINLKKELEELFKSKKRQQLNQELVELFKSKKRRPLNQWDEQLIEIFAALPWVQGNPELVESYRQSLALAPETDQALLEKMRNFDAELAAQLARPEVPASWNKGFLIEWLSVKALKVIGWGFDGVPGLGEWFDAVTDLAGESLREDPPKGLAAAAFRFIQLGAVMAVMVSGMYWIADLAFGPRTAWWPPATLLGVGAIYLVYGVCSRRAWALLAGPTSASLAVLAANAALGGGYDKVVAEVLVLGAAWGLAAKKARNPWLRRGLLAGFVVTTLVLVPFVLAAAFFHYRGL